MVRRSAGERMKKGKSLIVTLVSVFGLSMVIGEVGYFISSEWKTRQFVLDAQMDAGRLASKIHSGPPEPLYNQDDLDQATLNRLSPQMPHASTITTYSAEQINAARRKIQCVRAWAEKIQNEQVKTSYLKWLGYYDKDWNDADERRIHPTKPDNSWEAEYAAKNARANAMKIVHPPAQTCQGSEIASKQ